LVTIDKLHEKLYRMIVLEFNNSPLLDLAENVEVIQREPNFVLFKYKKLMSFLFLLASGVALFLYSLKLYVLSID